MGGAEVNTVHYSFTHNYIFTTTLNTNKSNAEVDGNYGPEGDRLCYTSCQLMDLKFAVLFGIQKQPNTNNDVATF